MIPQMQFVSKKTSGCTGFYPGPKVGDREELPMFHPVKILDEKGKIKKVLSQKSLSRKYWDTFFDNPAARKKGKGRRRQPKKDTAVTDKMGMSYEELHFSED